MPYGSDSKVVKRVPKSQPRAALDMPMSQRSAITGKFKPRTQTGTPVQKSQTKNGVLPAVQPRRKPVLGGVYED